MFACVSNDDDDSVTGISRRGGKRQVEQEDELINKVLEEGLRLKKRCKALTTALSDADSRAVAQREADQKGYQENIFKVQQQIDVEASRLASAHSIELGHLCDTKNREIDELHRCNSVFVAAEQVKNRRSLSEHICQNLTQATRKNVL